MTPEVDGRIRRVARNPSNGLPPRWVEPQRLTISTVSDAVVVSLAGRTTNGSELTTAHSYNTAGSIIRERCLDSAPGEGIVRAPIGLPTSDA